jgi:predicted unusual protein kinase regulating ubiquinone biosynthesis (AarF/ABC1/UbiB family)
MYREIWNLVQTGWIVLYETVLFGIFDDYSVFIDRLAYKLSRQNILYVKVFQSIALNNQFIDDQTNNRLLRFTDNVPWSKKDIDYATLSALGEENNLVFNNTSPINSGMISIVFKAHQKDTDEPVIIKMKRNDIESTLDDAIKNLMFFVRICSSFSFFRKIRFEEIVSKNIDCIRHQVNFFEEVDNMLKMKEVCKNLKYIVVPNVFVTVTEKYNDVIMMQFIDGITIGKIADEDYAGFAKQVIKFAIATTLFSGIVHGDLHAGNILFIKDDDAPKYKYKLGVLDYGIIYTIDKQLQRGLLDVISGMFVVSPEATAEKIMLSGMVEPVEAVRSMPKEHYDNISTILTQIVRDVLKETKKFTVMHMCRFFNDIGAYLSTNSISDLGLYPSDSLIRLQMCLVMLQGVAITLCKDKYMDITEESVDELFHTKLFKSDEDDFVFLTETNDT